MLIFPDEESGDSTQPEDEDSDAGETDEHERDTDLSPGEGGGGGGNGVGDQLERRGGTSSGPPRSNLAPQNMQWAIRWVKNYFQMYAFLFISTHF